MSSPSLYNLLKSADLLSYHDQLKTTLKLRNAGDLAYCEEKDFASIGMSRPEQKRLKQECSKHNVPGPSTSTSTSLAYKLKKKVFGGGSEPVANHVSECTSPTDTQHVIAAEDINLCKELGKGEFGCVYQAAWHIENKAEVLQVAVKRVLPEKLVSNPNSFLQEAAIMCKMRHENVIRLYGVVLDTKAVMLVCFVRKL
uniref:non-specific protein-tyrosine kinase n=1 Tax=Ditylenchus dipsaci TaxID=166011 RepID=A0A915EHW5_9BILA